MSCRFCGGTDEVRRHGKDSNGNQRFRCSDCKRTFQLEYPYVADRHERYSPGNAGIRDTARVLKVGCMGLTRFRKLNPRQVTRFTDKVKDIELICDVTMGIC
ncbi:transposase [Desulfotalea psychrophila]|uniref:Probable transposase InsA n=1 Tax=Desulfotalea psychrophila (strain LSv54 / DSM 12343) TaxID=177439 RepID=Q6AKY5_DESPS|nr:probable transposase InsA [Desulfotalea psychrophila LSv54]